jgi:hypothetical protein
MFLGAGLREFTRFSGSRGTDQPFIFLPAAKSLLLLLQCFQSKVLLLHNLWKMAVAPKLLMISTITPIISGLRPVRS